MCGPIEYRFLAVLVINRVASKGDPNRLYQATRIHSVRRPNQMPSEEGGILAKADE